MFRYIKWKLKHSLIATPCTPPPSFCFSAPPPSLHRVWHVVISPCAVPPCTATNGEGSYFENRDSQEVFIMSTACRRREGNRERETRQRPIIILFIGARPDVTFSHPPPSVRNNLLKWFSAVNESTHRYFDFSEVENNVSETCKARPRRS